jgi:hypothetical protein
MILCLEILFSKWIPCKQRAAEYMQEFSADLNHAMCNIQNRTIAVV